MKNPFLKSFLLSSLVLASCSTMNKHKTTEKTESDSTGRTRTKDDLQVHSTVSVKSSRPVDLPADTVAGYGVFATGADTASVDLIHLTNGNITLDVTAKRQKDGTTKVDARATTAAKQVAAPVDSTATVDSTSRRTVDQKATTQQEIVVKDKQVARKGPEVGALIGGLLVGLLAIAAIICWIYVRIKNKLPL